MYNITDYPNVWGIPVEEWNSKNRNQKKKVKKRYKNKLERSEEYTSSVRVLLQSSLDTFKIPSVGMNGLVFNTVSNQKEEKETNMSYDMTPAALEKTQREYLERRLDEVRWEKRSDLRDAFGQNGLKIETKAELEKAIKSYLVIREDAFDKEGKLKPFEYWADAYSFENPDKDDAGYELASKTMETEYQTRKDMIKVLPLDKGLEALQDFESQTFH